MVKAADLLAGDYTLVVTNVPYLGLRKQGPILRAFLSDHYDSMKADLACAFAERIVKLLSLAGRQECYSTELVLPARIPELPTSPCSYQQPRYAITPGEHAFDSPQAAGAFGALICFSASRPAQGMLLRSTWDVPPRQRRWPSWAQR